MNDYQKTAFGLASEVPKQLITLSTGIIALGATFAKDLFPAAATRTAFYCSAGLFLSSICFGVFTIMCLAGGLERPASDGSRGSIYKGNIVFCQVGQLLLFAAALILFVYYGYSASNGQTKPESPAQGAEAERSVLQLKLDNGSIVYVRPGVDGQIMIKKKN